MEVRERDENHDNEYFYNTNKYHIIEDADGDM